MSWSWHLPCNGNQPKRANDQQQQAKRALFIPIFIQMKNQEEQQWVTKSNEKRPKATKSNKKQKRKWAMKNQTNNKRHKKSKWEPGFFNWYKTDNYVVYDNTVSFAISKVWKIL